MDGRTCTLGKGNPDFFSMVDSLSDKDRLYAITAYNTAPTLLNLKPANLLSFTDNRNKMLSAWRLHGDEVCRKLGLSAVELSAKTGSAVVLFYRDDALENVIRGNAEAGFLAEHGYRASDPLSRHLVRLQSRFKDACPHEIGIFLGIPVEDIRGFIEHGGQNCKLCRYWKVYHNPGKAAEIFSGFDTARKQVENSLIRRFSAEFRIGYRRTMYAADSIAQMV